LIDFRNYFISTLLSLTYLWLTFKEEEGAKAATAFSASWPL